MIGILEILAEETDGKTYKSSRFCYDTEIRIPSLSYDDRLDFTLNKDRYGETDRTLVTTKDLTRKAAEIRENTYPLFSYFLDGSRRIYKVDDIEFNKRIYPIVGGQVMVACCKRVSDREFTTQTYRKEMLFSIPKIAVSGEPKEDVFLNRLLKKINETERLQRLNTKFDRILTYDSKKNETEATSHRRKWLY